MKTSSREREVVYAVLAAALVAAILGAVVWSNWGFVEWMTGGVFKPRREEYEALLTSHALVGLTPEEGSRILAYPADVGMSGDGPSAQFYLEHLGFFVWITADLDERGRITRAELIVD
ncbi:MAG TPA: hypothetical protein VFF69_14585 [Phycisphaerales bacterium]|nr:hypothetical protein [Phycisphaerales bacterium]